MITADFVDLATNPEPQSIEGQNLVQEALDILTRCNSIRAVRDAGDVRRDEADMLTGMAKRANVSLLKARAQVMTTFGTLPQSLTVKNEDDVLTRAANTPQVEMSTIRKIADRLSFAVLPFSYLDERSYQGEKEDMRSAITGFDQKLSPWYNIFALAPVHFYDVQKHVDAEDDLPIYAGVHVSQAFMAIGMAIPMFRSLRANVAQLREHAKQTDKRVSSVEKDLQGLARRVQELQAAVEQQQQEMIIAKARGATMVAQLEELRSRSTFMAYEPMMLAIPKGKEPSGNVRALVGPCWGPDFEDIVVAALGFKKVKGQREALLKSADGWKSDYWRTGHRSRF